MNILIAEDDPASSRLLESILERRGFTVTCAKDGLKALEKIDRSRFDVVLTDWMMPNMDGVQLTREIRKRGRPSPLIIMVSSIDIEASKLRTLDSGADGFIKKPYRPQDLVHAIESGLGRLRQTTTASPKPKATAPPPPAKKPLLTPPPFVGVAIAASTGGPKVLREMVCELPALPHVAMFAVLHAPGWALEVAAEKLNEESRFKTVLGKEGVKIEPGCLYMAPGDRHMEVARGGVLHIHKGPPQNFVRPAADPLMSTFADMFGRFGIGVVLTGLGRDGTDGARSIQEHGGRLIVQDPKDAIAPPMPQCVIDAGLNPKVLKAKDISAHLAKDAQTLWAELSRTPQVHLT